MLSAFEDTGGTQFTMSQALRRHTDWSVRFVTRHQNYIGYAQDIFWPLDAPMPSGLQDLFDRSDVIHVQEQWSAVTPFTGWRDKPLVMHHHGTIFRVNDTAGLMATTREYGAYGICSTPDLTLIDPSLEWLPNPCNIERMRWIRAEVPHGGPVLRLAHSPTYRPLKHTDPFIALTADLPVIVDIIEWTDWESCLRRKAAADLFFDQLHIGYALSGIEAMAMGIPVIGGAYDRRIIDELLRRFDYLPFLMATPETLRDVIVHALDPDVRKTVATVGTAHVERWHAEDRVARQLVGIYEKAIALRGS